ncbi:hypothetical protein ACQ4PT_012747 [Festuca glaucescens]
MVMAKEVDELARKTPGKKSQAIDAFSRALQAIPTIIADNAGLDSAELISQLQAEHHKENSTAGIDVITGGLERSKSASPARPLFLAPLPSLSVAAAATQQSGWCQLNLGGGDIRCAPSSLTALGSALSLLCPLSPQQQPCAAGARTRGQRPGSPPFIFNIGDLQNLRYKP